MTTEELKEAIVSAYLETGRDHSTAELAVRMGCSESTVRRALARCGGGALDGVRAAQMTEEIRPRWYYGPTRAELRRRLQDQCQQPSNQPCGLPGHDCARHP